MLANLESSAVAPGLENVRFHSNPKEGQCQRMSKILNNCIDSSKVILKITQVGLQENVNREIPAVQAGFRNGRGTRDQIANMSWIL